MKEDFWRLTLVTHKGHARTESYLKFIEICVKAGITCVQLREKSLSNKELFSFARQLKYLLDANNIPLIVNDRVDLCIQLDALGVHLGQSDLDVTKARSRLGCNKIIGLSVNTIQQVQNSKSQPIDYIGVGAIFPTHHKPDVETIWGLEGLKKASLISSYPIVAIGGIHENNACSVMDAGADGIAAIGAFHQAQDPYVTSRKLINLIKDGQHDQCD